MQRRMYSHSQFSRMVGRALLHRPWVRSSPALSNELRSFCQQASIAPERSNDSSTAQQTNVGQIEPRMRIIFTCEQCNHRSASEFSKHSYEKGVVLIRCPGCKVFHLIADNKGWFRDQKVTIEDLAREKGVSMQQLSNGTAGSLEVSAEDLELLLKSQNSQSTKGFTPSKESTE